MKWDQPDAAQSLRFFHLEQHLEMPWGWKSEELYSSPAWGLACCMIHKSCFLQDLDFFICKVIPVLKFCIQSQKGTSWNLKRRLPEVGTRVSLVNFHAFMWYSASLCEVLTMFRGTEWKHIVEAGNVLSSGYWAKYDGGNRIRQEHFGGAPGYSSVGMWAKPFSSR